MKAMQQSEYAAARTFLETLIKSHPTPIMCSCEAFHSRRVVCRSTFKQASGISDFITFFPNRPEVAEAQLKSKLSTRI